MICEAAGGLQGSTHQRLASASSLKDSLPQPIIEPALGRSELSSSFGLILHELGLLPSLFLVTPEGIRGKIIQFKASLNRIRQSKGILQRQVRSLGPRRVESVDGIS